MRAEDVRWKNMYQDGSKRSYQTTPYAQKLDQCNIRDLWKRLMKSSDFNKRRDAVDKFNAKNRWRKRGLTMKLHGLSPVFVVMVRACPEAARRTQTP